MLSVLVPVFNVKSTLQSLILLLEFDPSIPGQDLRLLTTFRWADLSLNYDPYSSSKTASPAPFLVTGLLG